MNISPLLSELAATARLLLRTLAIAVCLLLAAPAWGAADEAEAPFSPETPAAGAEAEAKALMAAGHFADALAILRPPVEAGAVPANLLFLYGLAASEASQQPGLADDAREALLDDAIVAFHTMLVAHPGLVRVRLELARAFFRKGEDELARRHFEHVLAGGVPEPVAANVQDILNEIRARERWSYHVGFALAPDSNIGSGSAERIIYIPIGGVDLPFVRNAEELTTSGIGVSVWGGAEYQVPLADRLRLRAGGQFARREYERSRFDDFFLAANLGPRWLVDRETEVSLLASARQRWTGTSPDNRELGARLEVGRRVSPQVTAFLRASWHDRRYRTQPHLDGPVMDASLSGAWVVTPTVRTNLSLGYGRERPRWERDRNSSRWLGAGVSVILPLGFTVGAAAATCAGPTTGGAGPRMCRTAARGRTAPTACAPRCTTGPSPSSASAPSWWWCGRSGRPTRSSTTMSARGASFASCSSSERAPMILLEDWPLLAVLVCGLVAVGLVVLFKLM